jgi:hypothetical protein
MRRVDSVEEVSIVLEYCTVDRYKYSCVGQSTYMTNTVLY